MVAHGDNRGGKSTSPKPPPGRHRPVAPPPGLRTIVVFQSPPVAPRATMCARGGGSKRRASQSLDPPYKRRRDIWRLRRASQSLDPPYEDCPNTPLVLSVRFAAANSNTS